MKRTCTLFLLFLLFLPFSIFSADVSIPALELVTRGWMDSGLFKLSTRGNMEMDIGGGYKFGGRIKFGVESDDLLSGNIDLNNIEEPDISDIKDYLNSQTTLNFKLASVVIRDVFSLPLDLSFFTGQFDTYCSGEFFPDYFGTPSIKSVFGGYMDFPEGIRYDGIHRVSGTGFKFATNFGSDWNHTSLYLYQDSYLGSGRYSTDLRTMINLDFFKAEAFIGGSFPLSTYGFYKAGLLLYLKAGTTGEFLTQIGIPRWDPVNDPFSINLFYFLFEPRVNINFFSIILTLLWHPQYYGEYILVETGELGSADINVNFLLQDYEKSPLSGGIENKFSYSTSGSTQFKFLVSPYLSIITSGVIWDFKINVKLLPFALTDIVEGFIGIKAEF